MAAHNGAEWITDQIASILAQVDVAIELVIRDDASTDETVATIGRWAAEPRVRLLSSPAPTGSAAQNFLWLLRNAPLDHHEFVALADQDDIWHEDKISRACRSLRESGAAGYSSAVTALWSNGTQRTLRQADAETVSDFLFEGAGQGCTFVLTAAFVRTLRAFLDERSVRLDAVHYHDWTIYALARSWRKTWHFDPISAMYYRQHGRNDTGARLSIRGVTKRFALLKRGWYRRQLLAIANVCAAAAPQDPLIGLWSATLREPAGWARKFRIGRFCLAGGRRRRSDNVILVISALFGWI